jgi:hypothetical protein
MELVSVICDDLFNTKIDQFESAFVGDELKGPAHATDTVLKQRIEKIRRNGYAEQSKIATCGSCRLASIW